MQLDASDQGGTNFVYINEGGPRRAVLGVQIDPASGKDGARAAEREPGRRGRRGGTGKG